jgi:hypothetical protein
VSLLGVVPVVVYSGADSAWRWLTAAAAEALLWTVYGTLLGLTYPIFAASARSKQDAGGGREPAVSDHWPYSDAQPG